jgi:hypothetical protein
MIRVGPKNGSLRRSAQLILKYFRIKLIKSLETKTQLYGFTQGNDGYPNDNAIIE